MQRIHVLIVEDEMIVAMDLAAGLEKDGYTIAGIADSYEEAVDIFTKNPVDILLMDIQIKGDVDGVDTALKLLKLKKVPVIFITAFVDDATVRRVKGAGPAAYLTKPYSIENVRIAIDLALHQAAQNTPLQAERAGRKLEKEQFLLLNNAVFIKQNYRFVKFQLSEIAFVAADNNHTVIQVNGQKIIVRVSLSEVLDKLNFSNLIRVHRSYAVNLDKISSFDEEEIRVGDVTVPIGRNFKQEFLNNFNIR